MEITLALLSETSQLLFSSPNSVGPPPPIALLDPINALDQEIRMLRRKDDRKVRDKNFTLITVPRYKTEEFRQHFRLSRGTFEILLNVVAPFIRNQESGHPSADPESQLLMTLWTLATPECFRAVLSERFDMERGNANRIFYRCCDAINQRGRSYLSWPNQEEIERNAEAFSNLRRRNFPGAIGCVDGCHIPIKQPHHDKSSYYSRNKYHSVVFQGICDHTMKFIDVFVGWPGAAHDARIWQNSPIFQQLDGGGLNEDYHLLGDSAYPISTFVLVPFKDDGHLTPAQRNYNKVLSSSRVLIEQAFGLLKTRFRRLKFLDVSTITNASRIVVTSCILHNLCLMNRDDLMEEIEPADNGGHEDYDGLGNVVEIRGQDKRFEICNELYFG